MTPTRSRRGAPDPGSRRGAIPIARACLGGLVAAGLLLSPAGLGAQEDAGDRADEPGEIRGQVVDVARDAPVGMARVRIPELGRATIADADGRFRFRDVPPGDYEIRVEFLGYRTTVGRLEVRPGEEHEIEVRTRPGPVRVEDLTVSARALTWVPGFRDRRESRRGHFFTRGEIEAADPGHLTDLLRGAEGVRIGFNRSAHGPSKFYPQFFDRGPGRGVFCRPAVFVDGKLMGPGRPYWHFNEIPPDRVLAMEVYYRESDLPDAIDYSDLGSRDQGLGVLAGGRSDGLPEVDAGRTAGSGARQILADAGIEDLFDRRIPDRDEDLDLARTTLAGLYDRPPSVEHCGAIFVWTRVFPHREG